MSVESKTQTYHGRVGRGGARRGGGTKRGRAEWHADGSIRPGEKLICSFQDLQGIEDNCPERLFGSAKKTNPVYVHRLLDTTSGRMSPKGFREGGV